MFETNSCLREILREQTIDYELMHNLHLLIEDVREFGIDSPVLAMYYQFDKFTEVSGLESIRS